MDDLQKFTEFLYDGLEGYVYVPVKDKTQKWNPNFFQWPEQKKELLAFIETSKHDGDVYISPSIFKEKSSKKSSVKATNVAWVEFDGNISEFKDIPEPSVIVQSSTKDHLHCYWKIPVATGDAVEEINRRLTYYLGADSSGWDANQVLRPPNTLNWKGIASKPVTLVKADVGLEYSFEKFDKAPVVKQPIETIEYGQLVEVEGLKLPEELAELVFKRKPLLGKRSSFLTALAYTLAEHGYNQLQIVSCLYEADHRIKKFVGREDQLLRLSELASLALLKVQIENYVESFSPLEIINHKDNLEWRIPGWLHVRGMMLLSGAPSVGKTQYSLDLGYKLATGKSIWGSAGVHPLRVLVLSLEMDVVEIKYIFEHHARAFDNHELWNTNMRVYCMDDGSFSQYERIIQDFKPDVVIVDSLTELAQEDVKESEARTIMRWFKKMRRKYDCGFIVIHHNRKANDSNKKPRKLSDLYGSFIFGKLSETVISLWQEENKDYIDVDILKARFGSRSPKRIRRTEHLTFDEVDISVVVNDTSETGRVIGMFGEGGIAILNPS